jgi:hypothetical protein
MQDVQTTNLKLARRESDTSCSRNHAISSESTQKLTEAAGTNEVAMRALQLYIGLFAKLPLTIPGAHGVHFSNRLQPWDQRPATYIMTVPGPLFILSPRGTFFFISWPGTHAHCHIYLIYVHICYYLQIWFTLGIWLFCVQVLGHHLSTSFLQVYIQHWHVVSPAVLHLHSQSHPLILAFRIPISGSAVLTPPFAFLVLYPVVFLPT